MSPAELRALLEQPYTREHWKALLTALFPQRAFFAATKPNELHRANEHDTVQAITPIGDVKLTDGHTIGLFEVELLPGAVELERNKVAIRRTVDAHVHDSGHGGALISFFDPGKGVWRFSYYSRTLGDDGRWQAAHRKRYTYLLGAGEVCRTAADQFTDLAKNSGQVTLKDLQNAFSVEKVSKAFFKEYKEHYQNFVQHLTGKRYVKEQGKWKEKKIHGPSDKLITCFNGNEKDARDFCKKLMGRLVFLYFVQKKRWLGASTTDYTDGLPDFIFQLFRSSGGNEVFYPNVLVDLFFDTLNNGDRNDANYKMPGGGTRKVPFLNGGLFDKDELDRQTIRRVLTFPPELFHNPARAEDPDKRGFLDFLGAYNFTVYEAGPEEETIAVDPEMLGHIFENLLEDNKDKGAFYTPKEIVHYMCQESLTQYLRNSLVRNSNRTSTKDLEDQLRQFLADGTIGDLAANAGALLEALHSVKVCDPAIGSGAFPMGILHTIFHAVEYLKELAPAEFKRVWKLKEWDPAEVKLRIIQHSIYGVDIERGAVDIARLRFWLSIIVDERAPRTLPNLDYRIVVGDSLLGKFNGEVLEINWDLKGTSAKEREIHELIEQLNGKCADFFKDKKQKEKTKLAGQIRALKIDLLIKQLEFNRDKYREQSVRTDKLFGLNKKETEEALLVRDRLEGFEAALRKLNALPKDTNDTLNYFDWQLDFPEVLNTHVVEDTGFDIVIANPPYMRVQQVQKAMPEFKKALEAKYTNAKGAWDLANVFFERAVQLVKASGNCCFIFPHKFFNSDSATVFRKYLMEGTYVDKILHFGANQVFNEADTYTCITQFSKAHNTGFQFAKVPFKAAFDPYLNSSAHFTFIDYRQLQKASKAYGENLWIMFAEPAEYEIFQRIYDRSVRLGALFADVFQGIATSKDELYIGDLVAQDSKHLELSFGEYGSAKVEKDLFRPMLKGSEVHRFAPLTASKHVLFPYAVDRATGEADIVDLATLKRKYPLTYKYVKDNEAAFKARESGKAGQMEHWHGYIYPKSLTKFDKMKLSSMEICSTHLNVTLNDTGVYHSTTVYSWIKEESTNESYEYFLAIVNSKLMWWFLLNTGDTLQGDARRVKSNYVNPFPLPARIGKELDTFFAKRVKKVMQQKRQGVNTKDLEADLDVLVSKLYGLSWEQAKVVDPGLGLSKAEYDAKELPGREGPTGNEHNGDGPVTGLTDDGTLFEKRD